MHFVIRVLTEFRANQGFLLASAVAYNTLLSLVPMLALILIVLSQVIDSNRLLETMDQYLDLVAPPGQADVLVGQIAVFLENWKLVGVVGFSDLAVLQFTDIYSVRECDVRHLFSSCARTPAAFPRLCHPALLLYPLAGSRPFGGKYRQRRFTRLG